MFIGCGLMNAGEIISDTLCGRLYLLRYKPVCTSENTSFIPANEVVFSSAFLQLQRIYHSAFIVVVFQRNFTRQKFSL